MKKSRFIMIVCFLFLVACQSSAAEEASTVTPTIVVTPVPSKTPQPTATPVIPTPTVEPPSILNEYLNDVTITYVDPFDENLGWGFDIGEIKDGVLEVVGDNWRGLVLNVRDFHEHEGILIKFTYSPDSVFDVIMDHGAWSTDEYRSFGIQFGNYPVASLWQSSNPLGNLNLHGNFRPQASVWYQMLIALGENGEFLAIMWDPADPTKVIQYHETIGEKWAGLNWTFRIGANSGTILFDDFSEVNFSGIK